MVGESIVHWMTFFKSKKNVSFKTKVSGSHIWATIKCNLCRSIELINQISTWLYVKGSRPIPNIVLYRVLQKTYKKCITIYVLRMNLYKCCTTIENSKLCTQVVHYYLLFCSTSFHEIIYDVIQPTFYFKKEFQLMYLFSSLLFIML